LLKAEFKRAHSPGLQYIWYTLLPFSKSQVPIFLLNTLFYWVAVCLFSLALARITVWLGWLPIVAALIPSTIHMSHIVNFDVASNVFLILFFALCLTLHYKQGSRTVFVLSIICLTAFLMSRYNAITCLLPMALFLSYMFERSQQIKKVVIGAVFITVLVWGINQVSIKTLVGEKPDYIKGFTATYDLLGMSVEQNHEGITKDFPDKLKQRVTEHYEKNGWLLFLYDDNHGFRTYPNVEKKFRRTATKGYWIREIVKDPLAYLRMRFKTASRMLTRETLGYEQNPLFLWSAYEKRSVAGFLKPYFKKKQLDPTRIKRPEGELNIFAKLYGTGLTGYMVLLPGNWGIPLVGILMLIVSLVLVLKGFKSDMLTNLIFMNVVAMAWYIPVLIVVQIPMARYVFPSNSLTIFSIPIFIITLLEASNHFSWKHFRLNAD